MKAAEEIHVKADNTRKAADEVLLVKATAVSAEEERARLAKIDATKAVAAATTAEKAASTAYASAIAHRADTKKPYDA